MCNVSIWGHLQTFTIFKCCFFRSPYSINCLAPYGGPVEPGLALGGFKKEDFTDARGIGLTFLVNNKLNETELEPALNWESR